MLTPRPYQLVGRDFLAGRTRALLADEMRVGKTPQAILAAEKIGAETVTVVCPAIAVPHWRREWVKWAPNHKLDLETVSYDRARINADQLLKRNRDVLIVDECHFAKNPDAQRTQIVYGQGGLGHTAKRIWALSGTPAPKHAAELWPMLRAFGITELTYERFVGRFCTGYYDRRTRQFRITGTRKERISEVRTMLSKVMLRRTRKEVAPELPDIDFHWFEIEDAAPVLKTPDTLTDEALLAWLEQHSGHNRENRIDVALAKVPVLVDEIVVAVENGLLERTVVFGWHVEPLYQLWDDLDRRGIRVAVLNGQTPPQERESIQADFRSGALQVVAANILAAGTAIDLSAASHGYFLELDWVPGNNLQAANRLISLEKSEPVSFDVLTWPGSMDDRVQSVLIRRVRELNQLL